MIMASCLISTATAANKSSAPSQGFMCGNGNSNYRVTRSNYNRIVEEISDQSNEYHRTSDATTVVSDIRIVKLKRVGNSPLGFSIRGGYEHGTGVFVSEVSANSEAEREGLQVL
ncbi:Whirlin-like protein [Leptotrombidium deliense]|uniref:Whirlin-like protein n=1 Tax=Leptotrombidium deliense TaxID=299467 RepID=A0A443SRW9_9ACAR|nr:Whirlin-like protein [Leptotrombidium deliense]